LRKLGSSLIKLSSFTTHIGSIANFSILDYAGISSGLSIKKLSDFSNGEIGSDKLSR
jgi:hypothetical protein